jgi:hypothetical protein
LHVTDSFTILIKNLDQLWQHRKMPLPPCTNDLPAERVEHIERFAAAWAISPVRPCPSVAVIEHWRALLSEWAADPSLPIYVRKRANNRGAEIAHPSGRKLIPTDNSPAHWAYTLACAGECPSLQTIRQWVEHDLIPVAMILTASERQNPTHPCVLSNQYNVNRQGWKLAHISPVGLNTKTHLVDLPLERLVQNFLNLMSPGNMFVIPLHWAGLGETIQVIEALASAR